MRSPLQPSPCAVKAGSTRCCCVRSIRCPPGARWLANWATASAQPSVPRSHPCNATPAAARPPGSRPGSSAAVGQRVADQEYAKADALALVLMEDPRVPAGSPAHPQPPATQQLVTGLRLRDPKGSPTSMQLRPWTSVAGPDPQPEGEPGDAYPDPAPAAPMAPPVSTSPESPDAALTDGGDVAPSHAWLSVAELARYLAGPPLEDPSLLEAKAADVDIDLSLDRPVGSALSVRSAPVADAAPQLPRAAKMDRMAEALHQVLVAEVASFERPTAMADTAPALDINLAIGPVAALDINPVTAESALDIELELTVAQPQLDPNLELDPAIDLALALSHDRARGADLDIDLAGPTERPSSVDLDLDLDPVLPTAAAGAVDPKPISRQIDPRDKAPAVAPDRLPRIVVRLAWRTGAAQSGGLAEPGRCITGGVWNASGRDLRLLARRANAAHARGHPRPSRSRRSHFAPGVRSGRRRSARKRAECVGGPAAGDDQSRAIGCALAPRRRPGGGWKHWISIGSAAASIPETVCRSPSASSALSTSTAVS